MACELPVVATDVDGARDAIIEGDNGFLHPPRDIEGMAKSALKLIRDPALRESMGRQGKARVMEFDISTSVATLEAAYQKYLSHL
jgi:glycosyltransferase involved in cell wall biosynthesis